MKDSHEYKGGILRSLSKASSCRLAHALCHDAKHGAHPAGLRHFPTLLLAPALQIKSHPSVLPDIGVQRA